jgi:hypothetical protein
VLWLDVLHNQPARNQQFGDPRVHSFRPAVHASTGRELPWYNLLPWKDFRTEHEPGKEFGEKPARLFEGGFPRLSSALLV